MICCVHVVLSYVHAAGMHATSEIHHSVTCTTCVCSYARGLNMNVLTKLHVNTYRATYQRNSKYYYTF